MATTNTLMDHREVLSEGFAELEQAEPSPSTGSGVNAAQREQFNSMPVIMWDGSGP